jgi:hypothetical protein
MRSASGSPSAAAEAGAADERVEIDAAGDDVAARVGRRDSRPALGGHRLERLRRDEGELVPGGAR